MRQFHLQETELSNDYFRSKDENPFIRGEMNKRLYGSVTAKEREAKKGRYYTVSWRGLNAQKGRIRIVFEYRQGKSGANAKTLAQTFQHASRGKTEFQVIGDAYQKGGDVIAWRMSLYEGAQLISVKKSYLWD